MTDLGGVANFCEPGGEPDEALLVENGVGAPREVRDGREDWDLDLVGYSERLQRPIARGWRRRPQRLEDQRADLQRVDVKLKEWVIVSCGVPSRARVAEGSDL